MAKQVIESADYFSPAYPDADRGLTVEQLKGNGMLDKCEAYAFHASGDKAPFDNYTDDLDAKWLANTMGMHKEKPNTADFLLEVFLKVTEYGKITE